MYVIGYIDPLREAAILTAVYIALQIFLSHYEYFYARSVESWALGPLLFSVIRPIVQNANVFHIYIPVYMYMEEERDVVYEWERRKTPGKSPIEQYKTPKDQ